MNRSEMVVQEVAGLKARLREHCRPGESVVAVVRIVSPLEPLSDEEWRAIFSAEDWRPHHRAVLEWIHDYGFYNVRGRMVAGFWLSEYVNINRHMEKHGLPYRLKSNGGINRIIRHEAIH